MPSPIEAFRARPLRTLVITLASVGAISFVFALAGGPGNDTLRSAGSSWSTKYSSMADAARNWAPAWSRTHSEPVGSVFAGVQQHELAEPRFSRDPSNGLMYPDNVNAARLNPYKRASATFVSLVRNNEAESMRMAMREVEAAFNRKFNYPWVMLNDEPFTDEFKRRVRGMTRSEIYFGVIPKEHWSYPSWVDQSKAAEGRRKMAEDHVIYGDSESYRHMCRFNSQFDYYWRVEPGVEFYCDVDYDVFQFMQANNKTYSFTVAIYEYERTIESLWPIVRQFVQEHPEHVAPDNSLAFLVDDMSQGFDARYNLCHFWSNFEIADLRFWRSKAYQDFFHYLDKTGNFFYERWGDAPVHSIAAALFLPSSRLHQFDDIGYRHNPYIDKKRYHDTGRCSCDPKSSFDEDGYSCVGH